MPSRGGMRASQGKHSPWGCAATVASVVTVWDLSGLPNAGLLALAGPTVLPHGFAAARSPWPYQPGSCEVKAGASARPSSTCRVGQAWEARGMVHGQKSAWTSGSAPRVAVDRPEPDRGGGCAPTGSSCGRTFPAAHSPLAGERRHRLARQGHCT
jgi:hypothetical protein